MAPPTPTLPLAALESSLATTPKGKPRVPPVDLATCPLKELVQYKCNAEPAPNGKGEPLVICEPVVRLFRVCAGGLHVETTAWEGWKAAQREKGP